MNPHRLTYVRNGPTFYRAALLCMSTSSSHGDGWEIRTSLERQGNFVRMRPRPTLRTAYLGLLDKFPDAIFPVPNGVVKVSNEIEEHAQRLFPVLFARN
jgi:hypothetical protein